MTTNTKKKFKLPHTFVLLFIILALIATATWLVPGGKYDTHLVNGKQLINSDCFVYIDSAPQGLVSLMKSPIKGFVEATQIIGFVLIVGGAFTTLHANTASPVQQNRLAQTAGQGTEGGRACPRAPRLPPIPDGSDTGGRDFGVRPSPGRRHPAGFLR